MSYKILIVDDSKLARMAAIKVLNVLYPDWTRIEAANASEAMNAMRESVPDLVLLDFNMPGRDGLDLAADLRDINPQMPAAIISANYQQQILDKARTLGVTFLPKPITEASLKGFLELAIQKIEKNQS